MLCFGVMHGERGASEFQQPRGHPHVIGMHVRENYLADFMPLNAALMHRSTQGFKGRLGLHSTVDEQVADWERDQKDVHRFQLEGEGKRE